MSQLWKYVAKSITSPLLRPRLVYFDPFFAAVKTCIPDDSKVERQENLAIRLSAAMNGYEGFVRSPKSSAPNVDIVDFCL